MMGRPVAEKVGAKIPSYFTDIREPLAKLLGTQDCKPTSIYPLVIMIADTLHEKTLKAGFPGTPLIRE